jgi:AraC family transcriptional regulator
MLRFFRLGHRTEKVPKIPSKHYNYVFFAPLDGSVQVMRQRGKLPEPERRKLWLFPPHTPHCFVCGPETERIVFAFSAVSPILENLLKQETFLESSLTDNDILFLREFGGTVGEHFLNPSAKSLLIFDKALNELSLMLLRNRDFAPFNSFAHETTGKIDRAVHYYIQHLQEQPKIASVAQAAGVSEAHLRRLFNQVFGQSPASFLSRLGLERAVQLMITTNETMDSIAAECGFTSASDFTRVFQKHYGCPPHVWRQHVSPLAKKRGKNERAETDRTVILKTIFSDLIGREDQAGP